MYFGKTKMIHEDDRGYIYNILREGNWKEINYVESQKGSQRGGHYHKKTLECFFIVSGSLEISIDNITNGASHKFKAKAKDVFVVEPYEVHKFEVLEDSVWINILSMPMDEKDKDIYRK